MDWDIIDGRSKKMNDKTTGLNRNGMSDREKFLREKKKPLIDKLVTPEMTGSREIGEDEYKSKSYIIEKGTNKQILPVKETPKQPVKQPVNLTSVEEAQDEVDELEQMFGGDGQTESSILKELFNSKNIKLKTELTGDQVSIISRLELMGDITKRPYLKTVLNEFRLHMVSKDRKSRGEFVEAHRDRQKNMQNGLMGMLGGLGGGGQGG